MSRFARTRQRGADLAIFGEIVDGAAVQLFHGLGLRCAPGAKSALPELGGVIAFVGEALSGSLCLRVPLVVAEGSHPLRASMPLTREDANDWLAELTNQLIGRVKNECVRRGLDFSVGVPRVEASVAGALTHARNVQSLLHRFTVVVGGDEHPVVVGVELVLPDDTPLWSGAPQIAEREGSLIRLSNEEEPA